MKKIMLLIALLMTVQIASAELLVDDIKGYVENEREGDVDESGGRFDVFQGDIIDLVVKVENTENTTTRVRLKGTIENIDDGDDITKEQGWFDVSSDDDRSKTLSFVIPDESNFDDYDFELEVFWKFDNDTEDDRRIDYEIRVNEEDEEDKEVDMDELVINLTNACEGIADSTEVCFGYVGRYDNCSDELSTTKEDRGTYKQKSDDLEIQTNTQKDTIAGLNSDKAELNRQITSLQNQVNSMIPRSQCDNQTAVMVSAAEKDKQTKNNQMLLFGGVAAVVIWFYLKKKKDKSTVSGSFDRDYVGHP